LNFRANFNYYKMIKMYDPKMKKTDLQILAQKQEKIIDGMCMFVFQLGLDDIFKRGVLEGEVIDISEVKEVIKNLKCPHCHPNCEAGCCD
jgi:hypothetical protein